MIKLYGRGQSRSFRALWALNEAGVEFDYQEVSGDFGKSSEYLAINSQGKVPSLTHDELVLTESGAMVNYAASFSPYELVPTSPKVRAVYDEFCYFVLSDFEQSLWTIGKHRFALPEEHRREAIMATAQWEFGKAQKALQRHLGDRQYAVDGRFTFADLMLAHTINWAIRFEMPVMQDFIAFRDQHYARPACASSLKAIGA